MMLSEHFSLEQFIQPKAKVFQSYPNQLTKEALINLEILALALEKVRHVLKTELVILSAYRDDELNQVMATQDPDSHRHGLAADFLAPPLTMPQMFKRLADSSLPFDRLINEWGWVHYAIDPAGKGRHLVQTLLPDKRLLDGMTA